jgi:hypothetical protein
LAELQAKYAELFGETTNARNKCWLMRRIAWRMQANREGGLSERAKARIAELANDADLRIMAPRAHGDAHQAPVAHSRSDDRVPMPGTVLTRPYKGGVVQVTVLERGFEFEGTVYRTLSAAAKAITGSHCNGFQFFRLGDYR